VCPIGLVGSWSALDLSIGLQWLTFEAPVVFVKGAFHPLGVVGRGFRRGSGPSTRRPAPLSRSLSLSLSLSFSCLS
jgi:hypothetical protein